MDKQKKLMGCGKQKHVLKGRGQAKNITSWKRAWPTVLEKMVPRFFLNAGRNVHAITTKDAPYLNKTMKWGMRAEKNRNDTNNQHRECVAVRK